MENIMILVRAIDQETARLAGQSYWLGWYKAKTEQSKELGNDGAVLYFQGRYDETQVAKLATERAIREYNELMQESIKTLWDGYNECI